jgi:UDP-N-acetylmuramyl tripeptide synthase
VDGHEFLGRAASAGAAAALVERRVGGVAIPQVVVADARRAMAVAAGWWYGDPSHELGTVGITGTDGKTTTAFLAVAALEAVGLSTGLIGTVDTKVGDILRRSGVQDSGAGSWRFLIAMSIRCIRSLLPCVSEYLVWTMIGGHCPLCQHE